MYSAVYLNFRSMKGVLDLSVLSRVLHSLSREGLVGSEGLNKTMAA